MNDFLNKFSDEESEVDLLDKRYLTFILDNRTFAFPIKDVLEIIEVQEATPVPEFPNYVKGIINTKGRVIPIIDLRLRFLMEEKEYTDRTCIVIASIKGVNVGFVVDTVNAVFEVDDENMAPPPAITTDKVGKYISGVAKTENGMIIVLDAEKILNEKDLQITSGIENE